MNNRHRSYKEVLLQDLNESPEEAIAYLTAAFEDYGRETFIQALDTVATAYGLIK